MTTPSQSKLRSIALLAALAALALAAVPGGARAADPEAPPRSPAHWLPGDPWVWNHWLPYDEQRLYRLLGVKRSDVWQQLRDDRRNLAQLARRQGWSVRRLSAALVAPWRGEVSPARLRTLRYRAQRTLTQGHLAQHIFFHSLHQAAVPGRSRAIFGVPTRAFTRLRRAEYSPLQIGMFYGRSPGGVQAAVIRTLRERAGRGVTSDSTPPQQARLLLSRQLSQVPRWLQQSRYNGPPRTHHHGSRRGTLVEKPRNYATNPAISGDGQHVAYEAYEQRLPEALRLGEINVFARTFSSGAERLVSRPEPGNPHSAYNATISRDGRFVAYEVAAGNLNFAKRYGRIDVRLHDAARDTTLELSPPAVASGQSRSTFNPSVSADGTKLAFSSVGADGHTVIWVRDLSSGQTELGTPRPDGAPAGDAYGGRLSGDGRTLVFTWVPRDGSLSHVYARDLLTRTTVLVSRANGSDSAPGDGYSSHAVVSHDGRWVAFSSAARNLGAPAPGVRVFVRDLRAGTTTLVSAGVRDSCFEPAISADGRRVAFTAARRGHSRVLVRDLASGATTHVSDSAARRGKSSGVSFDPSISEDGTKVAFASTRRDLGERPSVGARSVYVHDLTAGKTTLAGDGSPGVR